MVASCNCRLASCGDERGGEKKKERKKRGKARADVQVRKRGRRREEARRGQKRGGEGWGRVEGIYIQRDQGEIEIETSGTTMAVEIRRGGGNGGE